MLARIIQENLLEIRTANGKHNFVRLQDLSITSNCAIHKIASIKQILETTGQIIREIVPTQSKLISHFLLRLS